MRKAVLPSVLPLYLLAACLGCTGCTVIGAGAGALVDEAAKKHVDGEDAAMLRLGQRMSVMLKDGRRLKGRLEAFEMTPLDQYAVEYEQVKQQRPLNLELPALGADVRIEGSHERWAGQFIAFERTSVRVQPRGRAVEQSIPFDRIAYLQVADGIQLTREQLVRLAAYGSVPVLCQGLRVRTKGASESILLDFDEIAGVSYSTHNGLMFGATLGVVGDILLISSLEELDELE